MEVVFLSSEGGCVFMKPKKGSLWCDIPGVSMSNMVDLMCEQSLYGSSCFVIEFEGTSEVDLDSLKKLFVDSSKFITPWG